MVNGDPCSGVGYHHEWLEVPVRRRARKCTLSVVYPAMLCAQASGNTTNDPASPCAPPALTASEKVKTTTFIGTIADYASKKAILGSMIGFLMTFVYLNYSLSFWQGSRFLVWHETNLNAVITVLLAVMIGAFSL